MKRHTSGLPAIGNDAGRGTRFSTAVLIGHEDTRTGGIAGELTARITESCCEWLDALVLRVTAHDVPLPHARSLLAVRRLAAC